MDGLSAYCAMAILLRYAKEIEKRPEGPYGFMMAYWAGRMERIDIHIILMP